MTQQDIETLKKSIKGFAPKALLSSYILNHDELEQLITAIREDERQKFAEWCSDNVLDDEYRFCCPDPSKLIQQYITDTNQ